MKVPFQMRAPSKRWLALASILTVALVTLAWSFGRSRSRTTNFEGAPASAETRPSGRVQPLVSNTSLIDSDNDGIPDVEELRSFQDRDNFRRWFTAIAETQFYQLSDQWKAEQRDCAGLVRFAMREALRRHDRPWLQKMGPGYE